MLTYQFLTSLTPRQTQEIISLYRGAAWWSAERDDEGLVDRIVKGSHCFLTAQDHGKIIGMGRAISDHAHDAYLQDVTVQSDYRRRGVGRHLVSCLIERLQLDGIRWIGLIAGRGTHPFYHPLGFSVMPDSTPMLLDKPR
ncbi:MAG: GNAT family N-acetyltransferase [Syntrophobacterales bacterium]|jgi:spermidine synthase|nr:GNAT family N-acetyltransferase [Syntrophobacterales bacterium]